MARVHIRAIGLANGAFRSMQQIAAGPFYLPGPVSAPRWQLLSEQSPCMWRLRPVSQVTSGAGSHKAADHR